MICFSHGVSKYDNRPEQLNVDTFEQLAQWADQTRGTKKGEDFFCSAMTVGQHKNQKKYPEAGVYRQKHLTQSRRFLPMDCDGFTRPETLLAMLELLNRYTLFWYETASSTEDQPRVRLTIELDQETDCDEGIKLGETFANYINDQLKPESVAFDPSVWGGWQPNYTPVGNARLTFCSGEPLRVRQFLASSDPSHQISILSNSSQTGSATFPFTTDQVKELLSFISPDCNDKHRQRWRNLVWAIAAWDQSDVGETIAREWSQTGDYDKNEFDSVWASADPKRDDAVPFQYVIDEAIRNGFWPLESQLWTRTSPDSYSLRIDKPKQSAPKLNLSLLPALLVQWIDTESRRLGAPPDYLLVPILCCLAAAIGNNVGVSPKRRDQSWIVPCILWGAIIGPPSSLKSPSLARAMRFLNPIDSAYRNEYELAKANHALACDHAKQQKLPPPVEPKLKKMVVSDTTPEKLLELASHAPKALLNFHDELSTIIKQCDQTGHETKRGMYLAGWNGNSPYSQDRIGRGHIFVERFGIHLLGGMQPGPLSKYVKDATKHGEQNDGLLQRFQALVYPNQKATVGEEIPNDFNLMQKMEDCFERLHKTESSHVFSTEGLTGTIPFLRYDPDAQDRFNEWLSDVVERSQDPDLPEALQAHLGKYRSFIPTLSLIIHLVENEQSEITLDTLNRAIALSEYFWGHALKVYGGKRAACDYAVYEIAKRYHEGKINNTFKARELKQKEWSNLTDHSVVDEAIEALIEKGWLTESPSQQPNGRKTSYFQFTGTETFEGNEGAIHLCTNEEKLKINKKIVPPPTLQNTQNIGTTS